MIVLLSGCWQPLEVAQDVRSDGSALGEPNRDLLSKIGSDEPGIATPARTGKLQKRLPCPRAGTFSPNSPSYLLTRELTLKTTIVGKNWPAASANWLSPTRKESIWKFTGTVVRNWAHHIPSAHGGQRF